MTKKGVFILAIFFLALFVTLVNVQAADNETEQEKIDKAYQCLEDKIEDKTCGSMTTEEKIFALLVSGKCKSEVIADSDNEECWPSGDCDLEMTSKAVLALESVDVNTTKAEEWLLDQESVSTDLRWYLEIDSKNATKCTLGYEELRFEVQIDEDKKIDRNAGSCLTLTNDDYWYRISEQCYEKNFTISCDEDFLTTLLFREKDSDTYNVLDKVQSTVAGDTVTERIQSFCFEGARGVCDYIGSLWATSILDFTGHDVAKLLPYLYSSREKYETDFPDPLLYLISSKSEYKQNIFSMQAPLGFWLELRNKFYDTALAMLPFKSIENLGQKTDAKNWLFDEQEEVGCWNNDIVDTAFILYSFWPQGTTTTGGGDDDGNETDNNETNSCITAGFWCISQISCDGIVLNNYDCEGLTYCCDTNPAPQTCADSGGEICSTSTEYCKSGTKISTDDLSFYETCCVGGTCELKDTGGTGDEYDCEENFGVCEPYSCGDGYTQSYEFTCSESYVCCMNDGSGGTVDSSDSYWWIWVLFILIILVVLAIVFRDQLKDLILRIRTKSGRGKGSSGPSFGGPRGPRGPSPFPMRQPTSLPQRKIVPPEPKRQLPPRQIMKKKSPKELEEVLKKLKEMGR